MATTLIQISCEKIKGFINTFQNMPAFLALPEKERDQFFNWVSDKSGELTKTKYSLVFTNTPAMLIDHILQHHDHDLSRKQMIELREFREQTSGAIDLEFLDRIVDPNLRIIETNLYKLTIHPDYCIATKVGERFYPLNLTVKYHKAESFFPPSLHILANGHTLGKPVDIDFVSQSLSDSQLEYLIEDGVTYRQLMHKLGLNIKKKSLMYDDHFLKLIRDGNNLFDNAKPMMFNGVLMKRSSTWYESKLTLIDHQGMIIPEKELDTERNYNSSTRETAMHQLPIIRVFSFSQKSYFFADIRDLAEYPWNPNLINELIIEDKTKSLLNSLFSVDPDELMKDISRMQGQNLIILASGSPGTGKSLTAEVYSHKIQRAVYALEVSEIGYDPEKIEENLQKIFARIKKWNCILLFDEADIFLYERNQDLSRAVLVGVFLRVVEQFYGLMFLTSNRPESIDKAFSSRITLHIKYPELEAEARQKIWENLLINYADIKLKDPENLHILAAVPLNGREIRNQARLAKVLLNGKSVTCQEIYNALESTFVNK